MKISSINRWATLTGSPELGTGAGIAGTCAVGCGADAFGWAESTAACDRATAGGGAGLWAERSVAEGSVADDVGAAAIGASSGACRRI
jgi:hypothetical protein